MSNSIYNYDVVSPSLILADDFSYYKNGIPTLMAGEDFDNSIYYENYYHSTMDSKKIGFDKKTYKMIHKLYGKILFELDYLTIKPLNFNTRFEIMRNELLPSIVSNDLENAIDDICNTSKSLSRVIKSTNSHYINIFESRNFI